MKYILASIFSVFVLASFAQSQKNMAPSNQWSTYTETNQLKVEYKVVDCTYNSDGLAQRNVLLRYTNKTSSSIEVSWSLDLYYDDVCSTCNVTNGEYNFSISLSPNQVYEGDCELTHHYDRKLFVRHTNLTNHSELTNFELANLQVTQ